MQLKLIFLIIFFLVFPLLPSYARAAVFINEIAWMGSVNSANDEWLELFNDGQSTVSLDGWVLKSADEKLKINLKGAISDLGFFLLERTDDNTAPNITADFIYKGSLSNSGETLVLIDNSGAVVDQVDCQGGWPAGDNKTKQTMERIYRGSSPVNWQTSALPGGTPKATNGIKLITNDNEEMVRISPLSTSTAEIIETSPLPAEETIAPAKEITYPKNVFINEILPAPEGADEQNEWLEIYNNNDFAVDLAGWQIRDQVGAIKTYTWPENSLIKAKGFLVISRPESKIVLQNNGDGLTLLNPQGTIADQVAYPAAPANQSYNRASGGWAWSRILTPSQANQIDKASAAAQQKIAQKKSAASSTATTTQTLIGATPLAAQINQFSPTGPWPRIFSFLLAIAIAAASAMVVLFLKKKQKEKVKLQSKIG